MTEEYRPDPDELLSRIAAEESEAEAARSVRGKLKIFFGACAGVGKTYAMLSAGRQALGEGIGDLFAGSSFLSAAAIRRGRGDRTVRRH